MSFRRRSPRAAAAAAAAAAVVARAPPDKVLVLETEASEQASLSRASEEPATASGTPDKQAATSGASDELAFTPGTSDEQATPSWSSSEQAALSGTSYDHAAASEACDKPAAASGTSNEQAPTSGTSDKQAEESRASDEPAAPSGASDEPAAASGASDEPAAASGASDEPAAASGASDGPAAASGASDEPAAASGALNEPPLMSETSEEGTAGWAASEEPAGAAAPAGDDSGTCAAGGDPEPGEAAAAGGEDSAGVTSAQGSAGPNLNNVVVACNLPPNASRSRLRNMFEQFGKVTALCLERSSRYGLVKFGDKMGARNAVAASGSLSLYIQQCQVRVFPYLPRAVAKYGLFTYVKQCDMFMSRLKPQAAGPRRDDRCQQASGADPAGPCHIDRLPPELLLHVFSFLHMFRLLVVASRVCRRWEATVQGLLNGRRELDLRQYLPPSVRLTDVILRLLLIVLPGLRVLRIDGQARFCSGKALDIVAERCPSLEEIDLDGFRISMESLKKLCVNCPQLREVVQPRNYRFSEDLVWVLLRHLPCLRSLDLNGSSRVTGSCFSLLSDSLRRLSLAGCGGLRSENLRQVARCAQLRELDVSSLRNVKEADLAVALAGCTQLERLALRRQPLAPERCLPPAGLPALRHLDVDFCGNVTDATLRQLFQQLPELEELNIQGCLSVTEAGLAWLSHYRRLRVLNLSYLRCVSDAALDSLHGVPLEQLVLAGCSFDYNAFISPAVARVVLGCSSLTLLDLSAVKNLTASLVEDLASQLPAERAVVINVGGTDLEGMSPAPDGPLRLQDTNTVPRDIDELLTAVTTGGALAEFDWFKEFLQ